MFCPSCDDCPFLRFDSVNGRPVEEDGSTAFLSIKTTAAPSEIKIGNHRSESLLLSGRTEDNGDIWLALRSLTASGDSVVLESKKLRAEQYYQAPSLVVWFRNCNDVGDVADPSLVKATQPESGAPSWITVTQLCRSISWVLDKLVVVDIRRSSSYCRHGVLLNGRICTTLVAVKEASVGSSSNIVPTPPMVGLYNIVDLTLPVHWARYDVVKQIPSELFEVAGEEEAIPVKKFYQMEKWATRRACAQAQEETALSPLVIRRKWGHILFLSHAWEEKGVPGTPQDLEELKDAVRNYIEGILESLRHGIKNTTVKNVETEDDFGIWLDYPIVPNDEAHVEHCEVCKTKRREIIAKMTAIPSISTTIALHPRQVRRGWIMHELSNNTHKNICDTNLQGVAFDDDGNDGARLEYAHRINLMTDARVFFTNGSDGWSLRCHEFVRLGQMPRCWPSVTRVLLEEWEEAGVTDETDPKALDTLLKYGRTFGYDCQRLKRAMVDLPQHLARSFLPERSEMDEVDWINVSPPQPNPLFDADRSGTRREETTDAFDFEDVEREILKQREDMLMLKLDQHAHANICDAAAVLQRQQFVAVTMGLRAELLHGGGILHWVNLSSITHALTTVKRTVRLRDGQHKIFKASCSIALRPSESLQKQTEEFPSETQDLAKNGVPESSLRFALERLLSKKAEFGQDWMYKSGKTLLPQD